MGSEVMNYADFSKIRYAQCWEDADILIKALDVKEGGNYLSIASAGDNSISLLTKNPAKVVAIDLNPAQIACVELRKAAYKYLSYDEMIAFSGVRKCDDRISIYNKIKPELPASCFAFWDEHLQDIKTGFYHVGKFENYFALFRKIMKFVHTDATVNELLKPKTKLQRYDFYNHTWNNQQWRTMFKFFFSKTIMGKFGRDPAFFRYVDVPVSERILQRTKYALTELDTSKNPYLHYILKGNFGKTLPCALREENFNIIKKNIDNLEVRLWSVETALENMSDIKFDGFNLSDIFEYMSEDAMAKIYENIMKSANFNAKVVYWNMLAPRSLPNVFSDRVDCNNELAKDLLSQDKAFFYSALRIEEVVGVEANVLKKVAVNA